MHVRELQSRIRSVLSKAAGSCSNGSMKRMAAEYRAILNVRRLKQAGEPCHCSAFCYNLMYAPNALIVNRIAFVRKPDTISNYA
jgi:hypothetical protein